MLHRIKMAQIIRSKPKVLAAVTREKAYLKAREDADMLAERHGLVVADMPLLIQAFRNPDVRREIRKKRIDTITGEYLGMRDGVVFYEVWHSFGALAFTSKLEGALNCVSQWDGSTHIFSEEWKDAERGFYLCGGQNVARVHLDDLRKGNGAPSPGTPYIVFSRPGVDRTFKFMRMTGALDYDYFMRDDLVLMIAGSLENMDGLARMLFTSEASGGEGLRSVTVSTGVSGMHTDQSSGRLVCSGRLVYLGKSGQYFGGNNDLYRKGRFAAVALQKK